MNEATKYKSACVSDGCYRTSSRVLGGELLDELLQRRQLAPLDEAELLHEEDEVLERRVQVRLLAQRHHLREVLVVDVGVHAEQPL